MPSDAELAASVIAGLLAIVVAVAGIDVGAAFLMRGGREASTDD